MDSIDDAMIGRVEEAVDSRVAIGAFVGLLVVISVAVSSRDSVEEGGYHGLVREVSSIFGVFRRIRVVFLGVRGSASLQVGVGGAIYVLANFYSGDLKFSGTSIAASHLRGAASEGYEVRVNYGWGVESRKYDDDFSVDAKCDSQYLMVFRRLSGRLYTYGR